MKSRISGIVVHLVWPIQSFVEAPKGFVWVHSGQFSQFAILSLQEWIKAYNNIYKKVGLCSKIKFPTQLSPLLVCVYCAATSWVCLFWLFNISLYNCGEMFALDALYVDLFEYISQTHRDINDQFQQII